MRASREFARHDNPVIRHEKMSMNPGHCDARPFGAAFALALAIARRCGRFDGGHRATALREPSPR